MKDSLNSTMLDLNDFVSDVAGYRLFVATAKEQMTEEAFQQQLQSWVDQVKKYKEFAQLQNGKSYHTAVVVDILFKMIDDNDQTIEEKEMGKAWLVMAMFEMDPVLREEILNEKGGAA